MNRIICTTKGFEFMQIPNQWGSAWLDMATDLEWVPVQLFKYTYFEAMGILGKHLPSFEEYQTAERHGFRDIVQDMTDKWFWTSTIFEKFPESSYGFCGSHGLLQPGNMGFKANVKLVRRYKK